MRELIFCCPRCLVVDSTGISAGSDRTIEKIEHRPIRLHCKRCRSWIFVSVENAMISGFFEGPDKFRPVRLP